METLDVENLYSPGYSALTYMDEIPSTIDISVLYKSPKEYEKATKDICKTLNLDFDEDIYVNSDFLRFQGVMSDGMLRVLYAIAGVVIFIIVVSSVFVIRNSFSISVAEKNRQYGMLSSVGATSKQIRRNVIFEGMVIGLIAIPLGILLGIVAIMILLKIVNYLLADMLSGLGFTYSINLLAVLISVAISIITIYLSCFIPARRAAKISPIESIRGNNDIKIKAKKLKTSKLTKKLFGIGGVIASKNLKRSKKKYRTTVISLVISIFIFISLSSFLTLGTKTSQFYYMDFKFNMYVHSLSDGNKQIYEKMSKLENVDNSAYCYQSSLDIDNIKYASEFGKKFLENDPQPTGIAFMVYNNEYFKKYIKEIGLKESDYRTAVILLDYDTFYNEDGSKTVDRLYSLKPGDTVNVKSGDKEKTLTISKFTDVKPMGQKAVYYDHGIIVVSEDYIKEVFKEDVNNSDYYHLSDLFIKSSKPQELENTLNDLIKQGGDYYGLTVFNYETYMKQEQRMLLVVKIFLYGFITVITLIGVTNIFNTILIVEDNEAIIKGLKYLLEQENFDVTICKTAEDTMNVVGTKTFDLIILDITLPDGNGYELCEYIKKYTDIPIIFLTARDEEQDVVKGLDMGAEDYIIKPFRNRELLSRINNVLKRFNKENNKIIYENIEIDLDQKTVYVEGRDIELTALEFKILVLLFSNIGKVVTREQILEKIWDVAGNFVNDNTLTVYIKRIRSKLGSADCIKTIKGIGYQVQGGQK